MLIYLRELDLPKMFFGYIYSISLKNRMKYIATITISILLISCDAVNHLNYSVQNKTDKNIKIHIPNYPLEPSKGDFSVKVDTIINLSPNESIWVGTSQMDINFPWAIKNIYKEYPGICGLELIENDTLIKLDCTQSTWRYKKRWSRLRIKNSMMD